MLQPTIKRLNLAIAAILVIAGLIFAGATYLTLGSAEQVRATWQSYEQGPGRKMAILGGLRHAIGYGGVIHQFKNYMLRGDAPRIAKVRGKLKDLQSAMARYRDLGISPEEEAALTAIGAVFGKYATALGTAQKMVEAGATPKQVDKVVKIDDGPALQALAVLDRRLDAALQASAAGVDRQVAEQRMVALRSAAAVAIFMLAAIAGFLWVGQARVARPLGALGQVMRQLADGENEVEIPHAQRRDEVGAMAQTVEVFRENAIAMARLEGEKAEQERRTAEQQRQARLDMADGLERSIMGVVETINSSAAAMTRSAEAMTGTADQTTRNSTAVSTAAQQASGNVQTAAAAGEELTSSVREISRQVGDSSQISGGAVDEARQAMQQVRGLAEASQRIGEVVDLINDIAGQTNLLALNATIEAARAGEAGKGFAVVASEVKNLATQTAKATDEIGGQINAIQDATGNAVMAIEGISETINRISEIGASIAAAVEEQGAATNEISQNMQEAAQGTESVSDKIGEVNRGAGDTGQAATEMLGATGELSQQAGVLKDEVDRYLAEVRAA